MATQRFNQIQNADAARGPSSNYIAVARGRDLVVIRVVGRGNMLNAPALLEFTETQRQAGFSHFIFDFERCTGLDSTFMGVMVGIATGEETEEGVEAEAALTVSAVNVSKELLALLNMLGVDVFIKVRGVCELGKLETTMLPEKELGPAERSRLIYEAHQTLVEIDARNEAQFGELLNSLARELNLE